MTDELDEANRRVAEHPGFQAHTDNEAFQRSIEDVFGRNLRELVVLLEKAASDTDLAFELIQNVHDDRVRREFHAQTTQRLHNYLAATMSLVEHSRRLMRGREGEFADEYERQKGGLLANPEVPFMMDLRVFTQHRQLPVLAHSLSMTNINTPEAVFESEVELSTHALLKFKRWSPASRQFMKDQGEVVPLRPVVKKHGQLVFSFNAWLFNELQSQNVAALDEVNRLVIERNAILTGGTIEEVEAFTNRVTEERTWMPGPPRPLIDP